jgi:hypothetical protein
MHALGHVEISVGVEIDEPDALPGGHVAGDGADTDRAVAADHKCQLVLGDRVAHAASGVLHDLDDLGGVLCVSILAIRSPPPYLAVAVILDSDVRSSQHVEQTRLAQGARGLLLARSERPRTGRHADHAQPPRGHRR